MILNKDWEEEWSINYRVMGGGEIDVCIYIRRNVRKKRKIMNKSYENRK